MYNLIPSASCLSDIGRRGLLIIGHLNINSIHNKFEMLPLSIAQYVDILILSETKLDSTVSSMVFLFLIDLTKTVKTVASYCMYEIKSLFYR